MAPFGDGLINGDIYILWFCPDRPTLPWQRNLGQNWP